jgi:hypothetical protein
VTLIDNLRARPWALPLARGVFVALALAVFVAAVIPRQDHPPDLFGWDKANHFAAFYALSVVGAGAFPRYRLWALGAWLSGFGAAIELVQALPFVDRDSDVMDWLADSCGVLAALAPVLLARWRNPKPSRTPPDG